MFPIHPVLHLAKAIFAPALALFIDQWTKNPDSVTSVFFALLCISPTVLIGWQVGVGVFLASMIGTFWGLVFRVMFCGINCLSPPLLSTTDQWLLLVRVPISVAVSIYSLMVVGWSDPGRLSSGFFSALFVQLVHFSWAYQPIWFNDKAILATGLVRLIAIPTGVLAALVANAVVSYFFVGMIFRKRRKSIQRLIRGTIDIIDSDPNSPAAQNMFDLLMSYKVDVGLAASFSLFSLDGPHCRRA
jgi:hypothetical protein